MSDKLVFIDDPEPVVVSTAVTETWKILIVDDAPDIHAVTKIALSGFEFLGRRLELHHCYSGAEAKSFLKEHTDIAVILLDVVMETDDAGLCVVEYIRKNLKNQMARIVLRTGNPGQAPERRVITDYDINDYKEKSELTAQRLFTLMHSALRSYRDIINIERNKRGLEAIVEGSAAVFGCQSEVEFSERSVENVTALLASGRENLPFKTNGLALRADRDGNKHILAATPDFADFVGMAIDQGLAEELRTELEGVFESDGISQDQDRLAMTCRSKTGEVFALFFTGVASLSEFDVNLLELFARNTSIAFENLQLQRELRETQREIVYRMGEAIESGSNEPVHNVRQTAEICRILALTLGLSNEEADIIRLASPLHDLGKIALPEDIRQKPGAFTPEESAVMQSHTELGQKMLDGSERHVLQASAIIAGQHHEKWDGSGYPQGRKQDEIHVYGRIAAVADAFVELHQASEQDNVSAEDVLEAIRERSGSDFDPDVVNALAQSLEQVRTVGR